MRILGISGSSRKNSSNLKLLRYLENEHPKHQWMVYDKAGDLPLFNSDKAKDSMPADILHLKELIVHSDAVIFSTPEYLHNIPACLKNTLEWLTESGELDQKKVIALAYTPHFPRGEKALQSLIWSLQALNCNIVSQSLIHHTDIKLDNPLSIKSEDINEMLREMIELLSQ